MRYFTNQCLRVVEIVDFVFTDAINMLKHITSLYIISNFQITMCLGFELS